MPKKPSRLFAETENYRCEYINVLIKKYGERQDEGVDIHIHNFKVTKSANRIKKFQENPFGYLKSIKEKPFGYISSYECKSAKTTIQYWKKSVILQRRASFRKYVGVESSADHPTNLKYLSRNKAYETLLSVQKDKSYSSGEECESTLLNETEFDNDQTVSVDEDESTLSYGDSTFSSDTVKITSKKRPNVISGENETIKTLATRDKYSFSANNVQEFSNFTVKNCNVNLLKPNNHKKLDLLIENFSTVVTNSSVCKAPKIVCQKVAVHFKGISSPKEKDERNSVSSVYNDCSGTSFLDYISSKSTPKFKFSDIGLGISNKSSQISSFCNVKSLPYASNNSAKFSELQHSRTGMETFNKHYLASSDCNTESFSYISKKHVEFSKSKSEEVDRVQSSSDCNSKLYCASNKSTNGPKLRSREDRMAASNENCQTSDDSNAKSLPYASNKHTRASKLRPREDGKVISNKNCQTSSDCNAKSSYISNKSTGASKFRPREDGKVVSNKNCQSSSDCNVQALSYASTKSVDDPNLIPRDQTANKDYGISNDSNSESFKLIEDPNLKCGENGKLTSNKNCGKSNDCNAKSLSNASSKSIEDCNLKPKEGGKQTSNKDSGIPNDCNSVFYASTKSIENPYSKQRQDGKLTSNKNCGKSSNCNAQSLSSASYKSSEAPKLRSLLSYDSNECIKVVKLKSREDGTLESNKNYQTSTNSNAKSLLSYASHKCKKAPKLMSKESETVLSDENCQSSSDSNANQTPSDNTKSCTSNKSTESPKLKPRNNGAEISNKNVQTCYDFNSKSLPSASNKFAELLQLKFSKIDGETSNKNLQASGDCSAKSLSYVSNKHTEVAKIQTKDGEIVISKMNCETSNVCNSKSLSFASNKHTEVPKLKPREDGTEVSKTYFKASNVRNAKSLIYASDKSVEPRKHKYSDTGTKASNRNCQTLLSSFPLRCTSLSSSPLSNLGISVEIDPLSLKRVSDSKKPHKKKSSLSQSTLSFSKTKSYTKYLDESVKVDDLSLTSSPGKTPKNRQKKKKDECLK